MIYSARALVVLFGLLALSLVGTSSLAFANLSDRVLVIRNGNSPISRAIADDYVQRRALHNVLTIRCQDAAVDTHTPEGARKLRRLLEDAGYIVTDFGHLYSAIDNEAETIEFVTYQRDIERPIRAFLVNHPRIDFIVLTKGIPIRLRNVASVAGVMNRYSLDSYLAALDYDKIPDAVRVDFTGPEYFAEIYRKNGEEFHAQGWVNRFWNSAEPFSHAKFGGYLVTRLDGYTEADAKALTTRALQAEQAARAGKTPPGEILLDVPPQYGFTDKATQPYRILRAKRAAGKIVRITRDRDNGNFDSDMQLAAERLKTHGVPVELDVSDRFVGDRAGLMGYVSWASNDPRFDAAAYHSLTFAPGAIAETVVSSSARTFLPTQGGQSLIADLIAQGVSGAKGYTDEPLLLAIASPSILFDRYTQGWTLVESFYAASALVGWEDIVIGDPLLRAYP